MTTNLKDKQKDLQQLITGKIQELQNIENMRNQLTQEIVKLQGKDEMLKELIAEQTDHDIIADGITDINEDNVHHDVPESPQKK